jgi:hypothetical protein
MVLGDICMFVCIRVLALMLVRFRMGLHRSHGEGFSSVARLMSVDIAVFEFCKACTEFNI